MPRIRTIVPEFWEDERFSNVSLPACLLYIGMKNFADDSGVILANETIIKSKVFPAREDIRKQQVSGWLQELIENSILVPFTFENKSYYVMDFSSERIDKPQKSKIPAEVIENVLSGKKQSNSGTFANNPEQSGMFETTPAGKESKGEDCKGEEGYTRAGTRNPDPEPEKPKNENFEKFKQWIAANAPNVAKLKEPFTGRERHGQGTHCREDTRKEQTDDGAFRTRGLRPALKGACSIRTVRTRERGVHGSRKQEARLLGGSRRRHIVPR